MKCWSAECRMWVQQCNEICCNQTDRRFKLNLIFTARCVCIARTMPWQDVCPSVCLSHTSIVPKRLHISSQFFHRRVAPPFQFFHTKRDSNIPTGTPLMGASNARGYDKMTIFFTNVSLYLRNGYSQMCTCSETICKHRILFRSIQH